MKKRILFFIMFLLVIGAKAQFPPAAGQSGTTAIHKDSSAFVSWASQCMVQRGLQNIADTQSDTAGAGEAWMATGKSGLNGTVSLGDGGYAILTFESPIYNGPGWDFAVFENSFSDEFLELAHVEVSSDGTNFFRFPSTSLTQDTLQITSFGTLDATKINNLAGKYRGGFGTPFDLEELSHLPLDVNNISHVKIIDVIGTVSPLYASYDHLGNIINDPYPTAFPSGGFDLDAVGLIHGVNASIQNVNKEAKIHIYPNPASGFVNVNINEELVLKSISIKDMLGRTVLFRELESPFSDRFLRIETASLQSNIYVLVIETQTATLTQKILILNE